MSDLGFTWAPSGKAAQSANSKKKKLWIVDLVTIVNRYLRNCFITP